jgi:hypothetical protein
VKSKSKALKAICFVVMVRLQSTLYAGGGDHAPSFVEIPLPNSAPLVFKPVFLGIDGNSLVATKEIIIGSRGSPDFREWLTRCSISGGFVAPRGGRPDWLYYIQDSEISEAQFMAITGGSAANPELPKTGATPAEIQMFIEKLNAWVLTHALDSLPKRGGEPAYLRLPTESEWEFAARGGMSVGPDEFDRALPYSAEEIGSYEWSLENSDGRLRACRKLRPNPLGLYDMVGNASEMVLGLYSLEYAQGRLGGYIVRGCKCNEPARSFRTSRRSEVAPVADDGNPVRDPKIGFRLVLASMIFGGQTEGSKLEAAWNAHIETRPTSSPMRNDYSTLVRTTEADLSKARDQIRQLQQQMMKASEAQEDGASLAKKAEILEREKGDLLNQVNILSSRLTNVSAAIQASTQRNAAAWVRTASRAALDVYKESEKVKSLEPQVTMVPDIKGRLDAAQENLREALAQYRMALGSMVEIEQETIDNALKEFANVLNQKNIVQQRKLLGPLSQHLNHARLNAIPDEKFIVDNFASAIEF